MAFANANKEACIKKSKQDLLALGEAVRQLSSSSTASRHQRGLLQEDRRWDNSDYGKRGAQCKSKRDTGWEWEIARNRGKSVLHTVSWLHLDAKARCPSADYPLLPVREPLMIGKIVCGMYFALQEEAVINLDVLYAIFYLLGRFL
eukprot:1160793-Pelagomonas_calceolata.AAC.3